MKQITKEIICANKKETMKTSKKKQIEKETLQMQMEVRGDVTWREIII